MDNIQVSVILGSDSDVDLGKAAIKSLESFDIACELKVISAHRSPDVLVDYLKRPGAGGLLILEINNYENALKIIKNDPMIKNNLVEWKLNEWVDSNK